MTSTEPSTPHNPLVKRRSFDSQASNGTGNGNGSGSGRQSRFGERGITLGSARAVSAVVAGEGHGESGRVSGENKLSVGANGDSGEEARKAKAKFKVKRRGGSGIPAPASG